MKTFDLEVLNSVVNAVNVSVETIYDSTSMYGFDKAIHVEAKYQLYVGLSNVADYLGLSSYQVNSLTEKLFEANKEMFVEKAYIAFEGEYA